MKIIILIFSILLSFSMFGQYTGTASCSGGSLQYTVNYDQQSCDGACNGAYEIIIDNGVGPYTYSVTGPSYSSSLISDDVLCPGNYSITVTDDGQGISCDFNFSVATLVPNSFSLNITPVSASGFCDGTAEIIVSGGIPPYTYQWYNSSMTPISGETNSNIAGLCPGTYYVMFWDNTQPCGYGTGGYGTVGSGAIAVVIPDALSINITFVWPETCPGLCNAGFSFEVTGGSGNYSFAASGPFNGSYSQVYPVCEGAHFVQVTDDAGGYAYDEVLIWVVYPGGGIETIFTNETCIGSCDGTIIFENPWGTEIDSYSINGGTTWQSSPVFENLCPGFYDCRCQVIVDGGVLCHAPVDIVNLEAGANNSFGTDIIVACDSYTWIDGNTYTENNNIATYTFEGGASNGCDSVVTLNLTIVNDYPANLVPNEGLVAYYPFNNNAMDESGHGNDGTLLGPVAVNDRDLNPNSAYYFDGIDDYILVADPVPANLQIQNEITLSAWIYATAYPGSSNLGLIVGSQCDACGDKGVSIFLDGRTNPDGITSPPGHIHFQIGDGLSWHHSNSNSQVPLNQWVHIVATRKANEDAKIYYNGVSQPLGGLAWNGTISYTGAYFAMGRQRDISNRFFNGKMDEVRVYNRALSEDEVLDLYQSLYLTVVEDTLCPDNPVGIELSHSENGVSYQLIVDGAESGSPMIGNGGTLSFSSENLFSISELTINAVNVSSTCSCLLDTTITIVIEPEYLFTENHSICDGETYLWQGNTYSTENTYLESFSTVNGCDSIYTLNLGVNFPSSGTDVQTACDSYLWIDGVTYTESNNTATHYLTNAEGCDSVVTLNLTINNSNNGTDIQTACDSYLWIDGVTYSESNNIATHTLTNAEGCDSIVTLDLTISHSNTGIDVQTACNSYTWINGVTYNQSNNLATCILTNAEGCDSIVTLNLIINNSSAGTDIKTACDSYTWIDGITYTENNNTVTYTLTNAEGCDSVVTLNLTISNSNTGTDILTACDSYTWIDGVAYTENNNTATYMLTNAEGCDSLVTLNLTITNSNTGTDVQTACDSFVWIDGITYTESNNSAIYSLTNIEGCDSLIGLDLTINTVNTELTVNDPVITADAEGASYMWLDCNNDFLEIPGETNQIFTASVNGNYAVEIIENTCVDTSECVTVNGVGILLNETGSDLLIYPNPTSGKLFIDMGMEYSEISVKVFDVASKLVLDTKVTDSEVFEIEIPGLPGIYLMEINNVLNKKVVVRVVKVD